MGFLLGGLLLAPRASAGTWTQTSQQDFLSGTLSNVTATPEGTLHLTSNGTVWGNAGVVLPTGPPGAADSLYARYPFVLRESDGTYKMWYSGQDGYRNRMLYATSADGIVWTKHGVIIDVLTPPYYWDSVAGQSVLKIGSTYHMWFSAGYWSGGPFTFWAQIYHATSLDGVSWSVTGVALAPNQAWDVGLTGAPWVVQDRLGTYWLFFSGWDGSNTRVGVATSSNGTSFTPYAGNPIVALGSSGAWDSQDTNTPAATPGSTWRLLFAGTDRVTMSIGIATSSDGFHWTKSPGNPVYVPEPAPAFDSTSLSGPSPLDDPSGPRMYFAGGDGSTIQIGVYMNVSMYDPEGTYVSSVFDSGSRLTTWQSIQEGAQVPSTTGLTAALRSGDTATPDASWSAWQTVDASGRPPSPLRGRYVQYRLLLSAQVKTATPTIDDVTVTYALDQGPSATGLQPAGPGWLGAATLVWTPSDPEGDPQTAFEVQLSRDPSFAVIDVSSGPTNSTAYQWVPPALPDGTWWWRVRLSDGIAWGPWSTSSFQLDRSPPALSVLVPTAGSAIPVSGIPVVWIASDPYSGVDHVELQLDGGTPVTLGSSVSFYSFPPTNDGLHVVVVRAVDAVGNAVSESVPVTVDTVKPTVHFVSPNPDTTFTSSRVLVGWEADGTGSRIAGYRLRLDHDDPINLSADQTSYLLANVRDGDHVVEITAIDGAGNPATATLVFRVDTNVFSLSGPIGAWLDVALIVAAIGVAAFLSARQIRRRKKGPGPPPSP
ncbi:MAG TPA: hypothetical protein VK189_04710 [Thermoplasmata archaeon]|nr:hypothetical protein [Thermoplasmata archaeon]